MAATFEPMMDFDALRELESPWLRPGLLTRIYLLFWVLLELGFCVAGLEIVPGTGIGVEQRWTQDIGHLALVQVRASVHLH